MIPGDGRYEKLEHQSLFLHERGLVSPEMEECNRQLWLLERLAGRDPSKLDPKLVDRIHSDLSEAAVRQLKVVGLYAGWLDAWDEHNGIEVAPLEDLSAPPPAAEPTSAQRLLEVTEEFERNLQRLRETRVPEIVETADKSF